MRGQSGIGHHDPGPRYHTPDGDPQDPVPCLRAGVHDMNFLTHTVSGAAAGAWLAVAGTAVGALGSMGPDLDHVSSRPVRALGPVGWILTRLLRLVSKVLTGRKHRGISHSLLFAVLVGCLAALGAHRWLPSESAAYLGIAAFVGVVAALLGDLVTKASLQHLFWPFPITVHVPRWLRIRGGGAAETVVLCCVSTLGLWGSYLVLAGGSHV
jgi:membrane-bound metal-dependent hydrolase YbcI (DUF457 family)